MKIGIVSDTHGDLAAVRRVAAAGGPLDLWLHAGDFGADGELLAALSNIPCLAVAGNSDRAAGHRPDEFLRVSGRLIWLSHGHHCHVKRGLEELAGLARRHGADIAIFGHTHLALVERRGELLLINPGSAALPLSGGQPSYVLLEISDGGEPMVSILPLPAGKTPPKAKDC